MRRFMSKQHPNSIQTASKQHPILCPNKIQTASKHVFCLFFSASAVKVLKKNVSVFIGFIK